MHPPLKLISGQQRHETRPSSAGLRLHLASSAPIQRFGAQSQIRNAKAFPPSSMAVVQAPASYMSKPSLPVSPVSIGTMPSHDRQRVSPNERDHLDNSARLDTPCRDDNAEGPGGEFADGAQDASPSSDGPARKRRRSRKGLDKRFECSEDGCGKSYSRAEHL